MTDILCPNCDYEIFNDENELNHYLATFQKKHDRGLYYNYIIKNINLIDVDKIFDYYITIHNEKFNMYFINCVIQIQYNNIITNIEIINHNSRDYIIIENYLKSCKIDNINHIIINIGSCICNIKYKHYKNKPMSMLERKINYIICKYPELINQNHNHPLIRKYPNIKFNNI